MIFPTGEYQNKNAEDRQCLWEPSKDSLRRCIEYCRDNDVITVVLFQDKVIDIVHDKKSELSWSKINAKLDAAIEKTGNTCISAAWDVAVERYFDDNRNNYLFIFTDGNPEDGGPFCPDRCVNNHSIDDFCQRICDFCNGNKRKGYYVAITDNAINKEISQAISQSGCMKIIKKGEPWIFIDFDYYCVSVETTGMERGESVETTPVSYYGPHLRYPADVVSSDPYFNVALSGDAIEEGKARFRVALKNPDLDIEQLIRENAGLDEYRFNVTVQASSIHIEHPEVTVCVKLKPQRTLTLLGGEGGVDFGHTTYRKAFPILPFLCPAREPKDLTVDLQATFNNEAKERGAFQLFSVEGLDLSRCQVFYNGEPCTQGRFRVSSKDTESKLTIRFSSLFDKSHQSFSIQGVVSGSLDQVIGGLQGTYDKTELVELSAMAVVKKEANPLTLAAVMAFVAWLLATILLPFCRMIFKRLMEPMQVLVGEQPKPTLIEVSNCHRCILCAKHQTGYNGVFHRIYCGRIMYIHVNELSNPVTIRLCGDNLMLCWRGMYEVNGIACANRYRITPGKEYTIKEVTKGNILKIKIYK